MGSVWTPIWFPTTQILIFKFSLVLGFQIAKDYPSLCTLKKTVGESAEMQLNFSLDNNTREVEWKWYYEDKKDQFLVSWKLANDAPEWYKLADKYKHRFNSTRPALLSIRNLTVEMSGQYTACIKSHTGETKTDVFRLCVYEPIPHPKILTHSSLNTLDWCNVTLECGTPGVTENLNVAWLVKYLSGEEHQNETLGPAPNSRNLSLSLSLSQKNAHLTCVVSNPVEQKNATLDIRRICLWMGSFWRKWLCIGSLVVVLVMSLGAGAWIRKRTKMKTEKVVYGSAASPQAPPTENSADPHCSGIDIYDLPYTEINLLRDCEATTEKGSGCAKNPPKTPVVQTVYEKIRTRVQGGHLSHEDTGTL